MDTRTDNQEETEHFAFGVLHNLYWASETCEIGNAKVIRIDRLPKMIRRRLNQLYLGMATPACEMLADDFRLSSERHAVRVEFPVDGVGQFQGGEHQFAHAVDPVTSHYFLVGAATSNDDTISYDQSVKSLSDALSALRLVCGTYVSLACPYVTNGRFGEFIARPELSVSGRTKERIHTTVTDEIVAQIQEMAKHILECPSLVMPLSKLNSGLARLVRSYEDQLLDLVIGLESLYVPDSKTECGYRLRMRCAYHLDNGEASRRWEIIRQVRELYDIRSKLVHGGYSLGDAVRKSGKSFEHKHHAINVARSLLSSGLTRTMRESSLSNADRAKYFDRYVGSIPF